MNARRFVGITAAILLLVAAAYLLMAFFEHLPIEGTTLALDWRGLWSGLRGGIPKYGDTGLRNPPWSILPLLPLGLLTFRASWGLLSFITVAILIASVPRSSNTKIRWLGTALLATSFLTMRQLVDGNFEGLVIAGVLLILHGYGTLNPWVLAAGTLLATVKPQATWLLIACLAVYVLRTWPLREWLATSLMVGLVVVLSLIWFGRDWWNAMVSIPQRESIMDCSLPATVGRLGFPTWVFVILGGGLLAATLYIVLAGRPAIAREKAGMLIAASLLLSPYAAGNSFLTVLAVGIIPLLQSQPLAGAILVALTDLPYLTLFAPDVQFQWSTYYWTVMLAVTWAVLAWHTRSKPQFAVCNLHSRNEGQ